MRKLAVKSLKWSFFQQFSTQIINYLSVIVLAALIEPSIQGFVTLASIPVGLVGVLGSFGVREKIIKDKVIDESSKQAMFALINFLSIFMFLLSLALVFIIAIVYKSNYPFLTMLKYGILMSSINPIIIFNHYFESFQTRELNFKGIGILNMISLLFGIILSVWVAYLGFGYMALSLKMILPHLFNLILYLAFFKPSLKYKWTPEVYREFRSFSTFLTLNNIANYFVRNIDYIIIGKFFSPEILGQYAIAYKILLFPMKNVTSRIQQVALPMLSKLNIESSDFKSKYFMIISLLAFIIFPLMAFVGVTADVWVPLTFNQHYNLLVTMVGILSIVGAFQSLVSPVGTLYLLKENTKLMFRNSLINASVITLVFLISSYYGDIYTVIVAYASSWICLILPISMYWIFKMYNIRLTSFFVSIMPSAFCTILGIAIFYISKPYWSWPGMNPILQLFFSFVLLSSIFLLSYLTMNTKEESSLKFYYNLIRGK